LSLNTQLVEALWNGDYQQAAKKESLSQRNPVKLQVQGNISPPTACPFGGMSWLRPIFGFKRTGEIQI